MENLIWVLGTSDPEMEAIEALLRECGQAVTYASIDGRRVTPAEAYRSNQRFHSGATFVRVECSWEGAEGPICDHHNPGDPGYGRAPEAFFEASSIGQVVDLMSSSGIDIPMWQQWAPMSRHSRDDIPEPGLRTHRIGTMDVRLACVAGPEMRWIDLGSVASTDEMSTRIVSAAMRVPKVMRIVPPQILMTAAADHCLAAAYRGACRGVDPDELMRWRAESRAKFQNRHPQAVLADVSVAVVALMAAPEVVLEVTPGGHCGGESGSCGCRSGGYGYGYGGDTGGGNGDCYCDCIGCAAGDHYVLARDMRGVHVPELPEASARLGMCFISDGLPGRDGRVKVVCQSGSPEQIDAFMRVFGPSIGLVDIYGDPARGFAGGYHPALTP